MVEAVLLRIIQIDLDIALRIDYRPPVLTFRRPPSTTHATDSPGKIVVGTFQISLEVSTCFTSPCIRRTLRPNTPGPPRPSARFQGIFAKIIPMPHVSVIPEYIRPGPDEPTDREESRMDKTQSDSQQHQETRCNSHLAFQRHRLLAAFDGQTRRFPSQRPTRDVHHLRITTADELLAGLVRPRTAATNHIQRFALPHPGGTPSP